MQTKRIDFSTYSSLKIGNVCEVNIIADETDVNIALEQNLRLIGKANNMLIAPNATKLAMLDKNFDYIKDMGDFIEIGAATSASAMFRYFKAHNLAGLEFLQALPGSLGGLVKMNAGMKAYEIKESLCAINVNGIWQEAKHYPFNYRNSGICGIILAARFYKVQGFREQLLKDFITMRKAHPKEPSCGSCFKNPSNDYAGRLLESVGLKGYRIKDVGFSKSHANFLINLGNGDFSSAIALIELAKKRVFEASGIMLECEVQILN